MGFNRRQNKIMAAVMVVGVVTLVSQYGGGSFTAPPADQAGAQSSQNAASLDTKAILAHRSEGAMFEFGQAQKASLVPGKAETISVAHNALDF